MMLGHSFYVLPQSETEYTYHRMKKSNYYCPLKLFDSTKN